MSKNHNKKNYPKPPVTNNEMQVAEEVVEEKDEIVDAIVDGVQQMLNIRSTAEVKEGNVITTVGKGEKVKVVNPKKAGNEFYKIILTDGKKTEGYAMKKFIKFV